MPRRTRHRIAIALALTVAALGCSGPGDATAPMAIAACGLITRNEVSAVLGKEVEPGRSIDNGVTRDNAYSTTCLWVAQAEDTDKLDPKVRFGGRSYVMLNTMSWAGGAKNAGKFLESFVKASAEHAIDTKPVRVKIGASDALWWGDGIAGQQGNVSFGVSVAQIGDRAQRQPKATALATLVAERLKQMPN